MALPPHHTTNYTTLMEAVENGDVALVECRDRQSGEKCALICGVGFDPVTQEYAIKPFARMVEGNPFMQYELPDPDGGFSSSAYWNGEAA